MSLPDDEDDVEYTEGGSRIYRYPDKNESEDKPQWIPADMSDSAMEQICAHVETYIGKIDNVWHEIMSYRVHIDVHVINPTEDRPWYTLITTGMSDLPMTVPPGIEGRDYVELMICLPPTWQLEQDAFQDERNYWPIRLLKFLALFPHENSTWLHWGHTMPNGNPAEPFAPGVGFNGIVLGLPFAVPTEFWSLEIRPDKEITFLAVFPLYSEEMDLKLKKGADHLFDLFERSKFSEIVDINRKNLGKKGWWPF